ncbi:MAG: HD-GYP domain-containing protein [Bacillota bacterium]
MEKIPLKAKIYIAILIGLALGTSWFIYIQPDLKSVDLLSLVVFLIVIILFESFPVHLPRGGMITVSFAPVFAAILLFEPIFIIALGLLNELLYVRKDKTTPKALFNASQLTISVGLASVFYHYLNPTGLTISWQFFLAALGSLFVYFFLNWSFVTLILSFIQNFNFFSLWIINVKWAIPGFFCMAPLGILIAFIYTNIGFWGLVLFVVPLFLARYSFQSYINTRQSFLDTIESLSRAIDAKDRYTRGHSSRVAEYAVALARELKWPEDRVEMLKYIALIHDVGKIAIPEGILKKTGSLTEAEFNEMKNHSCIGAEVIRNNNFFAGGADMIRHHHERWDGAGYPDGLRGEAIPEGARILAVADAYDAMTSDRPYRKALTPQTALQEIREGAGSQFDPRMAEAFTRAYQKLNFSAKTSTEEEAPLYGELAAVSLLKDPPGK